MTAIGAFLAGLAIGIGVGYLIKRNNPYVKGVDELIDKIDKGPEEKLQELAKKLKEKLKK